MGTLNVPSRVTNGYQLIPHGTMNEALWYSFSSLSNLARKFSLILNHQRPK
jgi:hypothetical protein